MCRNESIRLLGAAYVVLLLGLPVTTNAMLIDNLDGTVSDTDLGLMWLKTPGPDFEYTDAVIWAGNLIFASYDDWRLPSALSFTSDDSDTLFNSTDNEFGHLYGDELNDPIGPADILPFVGYEDLWFWTGTEDLNNSSRAFAFFWSFDGLWFNQSADKEALNHVTAVRSIGDMTEIPEPSTIILFGAGLLCLFFFYLNTIKHSRYR